MPNTMTTKKRPWPTLEGRLSHPLTSRAEGLRQFQVTMPLSASAQRELKQSSAASLPGQSARETRWTPAQGRRGRRRAHCPAG